MADLEKATVTTSSSNLETVQPFTIEESTGLQVGRESAQLMDSSTLMCSSIGQSPAIVLSDQSSDPYQKICSWTNSNQLSNGKGNHRRRTISTSVDYDTSDGSGSDSDEADYDTNHSARSTHSSGSISGCESDSHANTISNSNKASEGMVSEGMVSEGMVSAETKTEDAPETSPDVGGTLSTDPAGASGVQSTESHDDDGDSVFANLADPLDATGGVEQERPAQRSSLRTNKNEIANLIEKAILDFCSSRTVETMRRMFAGVTNDTNMLQRDGGRHEDKSAAAPHPVTGELVKEGVIIGDVDVFAPRVQREYILPMRDALVEVFLKEPGVFRAICYRTRCQVEVTRRLLNRKLCIGGRWNKYMILRIAGPTLKCIVNCDTLLQKAVPSYKYRKEYTTPAACRVYLREEVPDNADLYFGFQRTGGASHRYGAIRLESPYKSSQLRNVGSCPWKLGLLRVGKMALAGSGVAMSMKHVYPSLGYRSTECLEPEYQGVNAVERVQTVHDQFQVRRQAALSLKRDLTIPVCR